MRHSLPVSVLLALLAATSVRADYPGAVFLMIFPDARTTALGGCGVALPDLDANAYYNPACLATGPHAATTWTHVNWLAGLFSGRSYDHAEVAYRHGTRLGLGASFTYMQTGLTDVVDERGEFIGRYRNYDLAAGLSTAYRMVPSLTGGVTLKAVYSYEHPYWIEPYPWPMRNGDAFTLAVDAGAQYQPFGPLTVGAAIENLGSRLRYDSTKGDPLPDLVRVGFALRPRIPGPVEVALVGDLWRDMVTPIEYSGGGDSALMFWENMRDGLGLELRIAKMASVRLGYFEDVQDQTGGILVGTEYCRRRISLLRYLLEHHTKPQDVGWCWGVGLEYRGLKFDIGVDESIYDFATRDVRFQLSGRL
jgi:hypothetical protein